MVQIGGAGISRRSAAPPVCRPRRADAGPSAADALKHGLERPCAWAVRAGDLAAAARRLKKAGVAVSDPERGGRQRPDGKRVDWQTAQVGEEGRGAFFPFLIQDFTPRNDRVYPRGKPSAPDFSGVTKVVIVVKDLDSAVKRYREAYGLPAPLKQVDKDFGAHLA